ncbi:branched-chain-amino-acid transaminase [Candidatus Sumerlaeota bacterium]|nr:branched-chain-amino-acid transaminase [Candidatus Sumerlaeota bacterium]
MGLKVFLNGKLVDKEEAKISIFDHGLLYGDGVFEGIRVYNKCIFRFQQHIDRLFASAKYIMLNIPMTKDELIQATIDTCRANNIQDGYIRMVVTRGEGTLGLAPWLCPEPTVFIIAANIQLYPEEYYKNGLSVITVPTTRNFPEAVNPRIKSLNYLNNILAKIEAHNAGVLEALMLNKDGYVVECTGDNLFLVKDGTLITPPVYLGALRGITRDCIIEIAQKLGYPVIEQPFTRFEVFNADECFLTGTAAEAIPVVKVDNRVIGDGKPGPITRRLIEEFRKITTVDGIKFD